MTERGRKLALLLPALALTACTVQGTAVTAPGPPPPPPTVPAPARHPGWQVVTFGQVNFEIPPTWTPQLKPGPNGEYQYPQPVYKLGYCPGKPNLARGLVLVRQHPSDDPADALTSIINDVVSHNFAEKSPKIDWGPMRTEPNAATAGAYVTVQVKDPCDAQKVAFGGRALRSLDNTGSFVLIAVGDQLVPDAAPEADLAKIPQSMWTTAR